MFTDITPCGERFIVHWCSSTFPSVLSSTSRLIFFTTRIETIAARIGCLSIVTTEIVQSAHSSWTRAPG